MNLERIERMVYCSIGHSFMNRRSRRNVLCNIRLLEQSSPPSLPSYLLLSPSSSLLLLFTILLPKEKWYFVFTYVLILIIAISSSSFVEIRERELSQRSHIIKRNFKTRSSHVSLRKQKIYMQDSFLLCCIFNSVG